MEDYKQRRQREADAEAQTHDPAHGLYVLGAPMLTEENAAPRARAEQEQLEHEHIPRCLCDRRVRRVAQLTDHHAVDNVQRSRHQVLHDNRQTYHQQLS